MIPHPALRELYVVPGLQFFDFQCLRCGKHVFVPHDWLTLQLSTGGWVCVTAYQDPCGNGFSVPVFVGRAG